jgi:hypothetical protein
LASAFTGIAGQAAGSNRGTMGTPAAADCWPEATVINNKVESAKVILRRRMYSYQEGIRIIPKYPR